MINDDYTPPNEHRRTQHKACIPILFICCECGTIASLWGGGVKVAAFREDTGKIMWKSAETKVVLLFQLKNRQNQKTKGGVEIGSNDRVWCKVSIFHIKRAGIIFFIFQPQRRTTEEYFFLFFFYARWKDKSRRAIHKLTSVTVSPLHSTTAFCTCSHLPHLISDGQTLRLESCFETVQTEEICHLFFHSSPMNANIMLENLKVSQWMRVRYRRGLYRSKS